MELQNSYTVMLAKIRAFRATKDVIAKSLNVFDVTIMQWLFLGVIAKEKGNTTSAAVAHELNVSTPLVTRFTQQLLEKKLIEITPDEQDKRTKHITLTRSGSVLLEKSEPVVREALKVWLDAIPREDVRTYITVLLHVAYKL